MTPLLDWLEARGFVTRSPNPNDRRSVLVHYKPQEQRVVGRLYRVLEGLEGEAERLGEDGQQTVLDFLTAMTRSVTEAASTPPERPA